MNGSILMRKHILAASVTHLYGIKRMVEHQSIQIRGEAISMQPCDKYFSQQKKDGKIPMYSWINIEKKPCYCSQC